MLKEITIKNFKSIADDTIELGRVNVFIGENGCGKSNILEAVGFASAYSENRVDNENLINKGIRVAKPSLIISNFKGKKQKDEFNIGLNFDNEEINRDLFFKSNNKENVNEIWEILEESQLREGYKSFKNRINDLKQGTKLSEQEILNHFLAYIEKERKKKPDFLAQIDEELQRKKIYNDFLIYTLNTPALRGFTHESRKEPVGIYGENLDVLIANFDTEEQEQLKKYNYLIDWLDNYFVDVNDLMKLKGYKLNRSKSTLYFSDKYMSKKNNIFSSENANEGILHVLFYLALMISKRTPKFFAIDNIESCLNPHLCRHLMEQLCILAKENDKQLLMTTHNPAILDGLNLFDEEIRLFEVKRLENGHTKTRRIKLKPDVQNDMGEKYKLSELWTRGFLGAISQNF